MDKLKLSKAFSKFGSQMGRSNQLPKNALTTGKLQMQKMEWVDGDYDWGGAYWGRSEKHGDMYHVEGNLKNEDGTTIIFIRALNRKRAKEQVLKQLPNVSFYR